MKKFFREFKEFALKGNMFDMAVGIIIGSCFSKVVSAFSNNLLLPLIKFCTGKIYTTEEILGFVYEFVNCFLELLLTSFILFLLVKLVNRSSKKKKVLKVETKRTCPYCKSEIHKDTLKCPHCASELACSLEFKNSDIEG